MVQHKLNVLRAHCDVEGRDYGAIEKTIMVSFLLARDDAGLAAKRERLSMGGPMHSFFCTVSQAVDIVGQYRDAGVQLLINADQRNDVETLELFASEVIPYFA